MKVVASRVLLLSLLISTVTVDAGTLYLKAGYAFQPFPFMESWPAREAFQIVSHYLLRPAWEFKAVGLIFGVSMGIDLNRDKFILSEWGIVSNYSWTKTTLRVPLEVTVAKGLDLSNELEFRFTCGLTSDSFLYNLWLRNGKTTIEETWVFPNLRTRAHLRFGIVVKAGVVYKLDDHLRLSGELPIHVVVNPNNYDFIQFNIGIDIGIGYSF